MCESDETSTALGHLDRAQAQLVLAGEEVVDVSTDALTANPAAE